MRRPTRADLITALIRSTPARRRDANPEASARDAARRADAMLAAWPEPVEPTGLPGADDPVAPGTFRVLARDYERGGQQVALVPNQRDLRLVAAGVAISLTLDNDRRLRVDLQPEGRQVPRLTVNDFHASAHQVLVNLHGRPYRADEDGVL